MKRWTRPVLILTVAAAVTVAGTYVAYANWIVPSRQVHLKIKSATMPRGVTPTVSDYWGGAVVSWGAQEIGPGARMQSYVVTAHRSEPSPLPDITHTVTAAGGATESATFSATELMGYEWYWTLVPRFQSWAGAESEKSARLMFAIPSIPHERLSPPVVIAPATAEAAVKGSPQRTPEQVVSSPTPSPSTTSPTSAIPVPTPTGSLQPLTPPSAFTPGPPPPFGS